MKSLRNGVAILLMLGANYELRPTQNRVEP